jgi:endonuclease-3
MGSERASVRRRRPARPASRKPARKTPAAPSARIANARQTPARRPASGQSPVPQPELRARTRTILRRLAKLYPEARCALHFRNPFELYVATVLSAQCTDERVNQVTPPLFARYPDAATMARAAREEIELLIRPTGFFRNKAKSIHTAAEKLVRDFGGNLPGTLEELITLPGTGRKTANVILGNAFNTPGITVDTHVRRLAQRLELTRETDPVKIEFELMALFPQPEWTNLSHRLIEHGRRVCHARRPECSACALRPVCPAGLRAGTA